MDLYEAMRTCRAVRRHQPDPIPDDVLRRVLEAATFAPTGGNAQPWRMIVVRDAESAARCAISTCRSGRTTRGNTCASPPGSPATRPRSAIACSAPRTISPNISRCRPYTWCSSSTCGACRSPTTDSDARRSWAAHRSTPPCRTCCSRVASRDSAACSPRCSARRNPRCARCSRSPIRGRRRPSCRSAGPSSKGHGPLTRRPVANMAFGDRFGGAL